MDQGVRWTARAAAQLDGIFEHVSHDSAERAVSLVQDIVEAVYSIPEYPRLGRMVCELESESVRERIVRGYRIVYEISDGPVQVLAVFHGSRLLRSALGDDP